MKVCSTHYYERTLPQPTLQANDSHNYTKFIAQVSPSEEALETSTDIGGPGPLLRPHVVPPLLRPHVLVETAFGAATGVNDKTVLPVTSLYSEPKHVTAKSNLVLSSTTVTIHAIARSPMKWFGNASIYFSVTHDLKDCF